MDFEQTSASASRLCSSAPQRKIVHPFGIPILVGILALLLGISAGAQIHGTPASVTSLGAGGQIRGVPASVTSLGPFGWQTPRFRVPVGFRPRLGQVYGRRRLGYAYGTVLPYAVPVYPLMYSDDPGNYASAYGDPTAGVDPRAYAVRSASPTESNAATSAPLPAAADPRPERTTMLVFQDGHRQEVGNYAIVGDKLYDLQAGGRRTIPLSALDLPATRQLNEDRGTDFVLPPARGG